MATERPFVCPLWLELPTFCPKDTIQLNEYETDPYFLQIFQSNTCLIIYMFCKSCEHGCESEIVQKYQYKKLLKKIK